MLAGLRASIPAPVRAPLYGLPAHLVARIGPLRVGIVHGDAESLAGWKFAQESLDDADVTPWRNAVRAASHIDVFACTHTCLAALRDFALPAGRLTVVNNGAAGMPNFSGTGFGVVTRIATSPSPHRPLYGLQRDGVYIDALAVDYDSDAFLERFLKRWPQGSSAYASYYRRIVAGPDYAHHAGGGPMKLSIIIPVLDEAAGIEAALVALAPLRADGAEIVVVDGGSRDDTLKLARPLADHVIAAPPGRASQMNAGAAIATGDLLVFLHADTRLPHGAGRLLLDGLARQSAAAWGRFDVRIDGGGMSAAAAGGADDEPALATDRHLHRRPGDIRHPRPPSTQRRRLSAYRLDGGFGAVGAAQARVAARWPCARA